MFQNIVPLISENGVGINTNITRWPTPSSTLRSTEDSVVQLSIAHNESNENPGYNTQRSVIRVTKSKEIEDTGKSVKGYAQLTLSVPKDTFTVTDARYLIAYLINFLIDPEGPTADAVSHEDLATVSRIYAGEP